MNHQILPKDSLSLELVARARSYGLKTYSDGKRILLTRDKPQGTGWYLVGIPVETEKGAA